MKATSSLTSKLKTINPEDILASDKATVNFITNIADVYNEFSNTNIAKECSIDKQLALTILEERIKNLSSLEDLENFILNLASAYEERDFDLSNLLEEIRCYQDCIGRISEGFSEGENLRLDSQSDIYYCSVATLNIKPKEIPASKNIFFEFFKNEITIIEQKLRARRENLKNSDISLEQEMLPIEIEEKDLAEVDSESEEDISNISSINLDLVKKVFFYTIKIASHLLIASTKMLNKIPRKNLDNPKEEIVGDHNKSSSLINILNIKGLSDFIDRLLGELFHNHFLNLKLNKNEENFRIAQNGSSEGSGVSTELVKTRYLFNIDLENLLKKLTRDLFSTSIRSNDTNFKQSLHVTDVWVALKKNGKLEKLEKFIERENKELLSSLFPKVKIRKINYNPDIYELGYKETEIRAKICPDKEITIPLSHKYEIKAITFLDKKGRIVPVSEDFTIKKGVFGSAKLKAPKDSRHIYYVTKKTIIDSSLLNSRISDELTKIIPKLEINNSQEEIDLLRLIDNYVDDSDKGLLWYKIKAQSGFYYTQDKFLKYFFDNLNENRLEGIEATKMGICDNFAFYLTANMNNFNNPSFILSGPSLNLNSSSEGSFIFNPGHSVCGSIIHNSISELDLTKKVFSEHLTSSKNLNKAGRKYLLNLINNGSDIPKIGREIKNLLTKNISFWSKFKLLLNKNTKTYGPKNYISDNSKDLSELDNLALQILAINQSFTLTMLFLEEKLSLVDKYAYADELPKFKLSKSEDPKLHYCTNSHLATLTKAVLSSKKYPDNSTKEAINWILLNSIPKEYLPKITDRGDNFDLIEKASDKFLKELEKNLIHKDLYDLSYDPYKTLSLNVENLVDVSIDRLNLFSNKELEILLINLTFLITLNINIEIVRENKNYLTDEDHTENSIYDLEVRGNSAAFKEDEFDRMCILLEKLLLNLIINDSKIENKKILVLAKSFLRACLFNNKIIDNRSLNEKCRALRAVGILQLYDNLYSNNNGSLFLNIICYGEELDYSIIDVLREITNEETSKLFNIEEALFEEFSKETFNIDSLVFLYSWLEKYNDSYDCQSLKNRLEDSFLEQIKLSLIRSKKSPFPQNIHINLPSLTAPASYIFSRIGNNIESVKIFKACSALVKINLIDKTNLEKIWPKESEEKVFDNLISLIKVGDKYDSCITISGLDISGRDELIPFHELEVIHHEFLSLTGAYRVEICNILKVLNKNTNEINLYLETLKDSFPSKWEHFLYKFFSSNIHDTKYLDTLKSLFHTHLNIQYNSKEIYKAFIWGMYYRVKASQTESIKGSFIPPSSSIKDISRKIDQKEKLNDIVKDYLEGFSIEPKLSEYVSDKLKLRMYLILSIISANEFELINNEENIVPSFILKGISLNKDNSITYNEEFTVWNNISSQYFFSHSSRFTLDLSDMLVKANEACMQYARLSVNTSSLYSKFLYANNISVKIKSTTGLFKEYRSYRTGDTRNMIDWKATGRAGRTLVKINEEKEKREINFLIDPEWLLEFSDYHSGLNKERVLNLFQHVILAEAEKIKVNLILTHCGKLEIFRAIKIKSTSNFINSLSNLLENVSYIILSELGNSLYDDNVGFNLLPIDLTNSPENIFICGLSKRNLDASSNQLNILQKKGHHVHLLKDL